MLPCTVLRYSTSAKPRATEICWVMLHAKLLICCWFFILLLPFFVSEEGGGDKDGKTWLELATLCLRTVTSNETETGAVAYF